MSLTMMEADTRALAARHACGIREDLLNLNTSHQQDTRGTFLIR